MTEGLLDHLRRDASRQLEGRVAVPEIVNADRRQACLREQPAEFLPEHCPIGS
ncbi:MAG: hypothetical protein M3Z28_11725 [Candidatus Dormibacteraeota bacterium]|nr:hypothetical protein [Candidatus Dormibacteraeota bacterium]